MRVAGHLALIGLALAASAGGPTPSPAQEGAAEIAFPVTFDHVWYRTGAPSAFGGAQHRGFLTVGIDAIELVGRKISLVWPVSNLRMISLGHLAGDVDTEWVILDVAGGEGTTRVGVRHGGKFGWGTRTDEIFRILREAARRAGVAQFAAPEDFEAYAELDFQFAMPIPAGWFTHHQSIVGVEGRALHGTVVASPEPLVEPGGADDSRARAVSRIGSGEVTAWIVARRVAPAGFDCEDGADDAATRLPAWIGDEPILAQGVDLVGASVESATLGGCNGLRLVATGPRVLDLRAVSDGTTLFLVGLRTSGERYESERPRFETGLAGFNLARTR